MGKSQTPLPIKTTGTAKQKIFASSTYGLNDTFKVMRNSKRFFEGLDLRSKGRYRELNLKLLWKVTCLLDLNLILCLCFHQTTLICLTYIYVVIGSNAPLTCHT